MAEGKEKVYFSGGILSIMFECHLSLVSTLDPKRREHRKILGSGKKIQMFSFNGVTQIHINHCLRLIS